MPERMRVKIEPMTPEHLDLFEDVDMVQVGARNMQNFELLKELGKTNKPILLKDGSSRYRDRPGEDALNYVYWLTAGSAYLTVIFCNALVDYLNERKTPYITRTVIDNFIREKFLGSRPVLQGYMFDPQLNDPGKFSEEEQKNTRQDNRTVLTYIAIHSDNVSHELHREKICCEAELSEKTTARRDIILDQLIRRRVLTKRGDYYKIEIELLRMWLRRERGDDF